MKKSDRIAALLPLGAEQHRAGYHPCYLAYFEQFNAQRYYEAHDVLEHLWLQARDENHSFFKGLIQLAGAYVHLQKQFVDPTHPKHSKRLRPAARLFSLAAGNLERFRPNHLGLDVAGLCDLCAKTAADLERLKFGHNPWSPTAAPSLQILHRELN